MRLLRVAIGPIICIDQLFLRFGQSFWTKEGPSLGAASQLRLKYMKSGVYAVTSVAVHNDKAASRRANNRDIIGRAFVASSGGIGCLLRQSQNDSH